jgi:hypothetical protein
MAAEPRKPLGWFLGLAGLLLLLTLGGFWWHARRRTRQAALATEAITYRGLGDPL